MASKRKLWSQESMEAATKSVVEYGKGVREAARLYNVPIETLRVNGHWSCAIWMSPWASYCPQ